LKSAISHRSLAIVALVLPGIALIVMLSALPCSGVAHAVAPGAPATDPRTLSCTHYLPLVSRGHPPPTLIEITQGIQQPDNSVTLIADRPTFVRLTLTATVPHSDVQAWLYGTRDGAPLPGSPLAAWNNPRTLEAAVNRNDLDDTFNFELPSSWISGDIILYAQASNSSTYSFIGGPVAVQFTPANPMHVTIVPIAYTCTSGGGGTTAPPEPYDYLTDFTYRTYPVPLILTSTHAALSYSGPCYDSLPDPTSGDWGAMLDAVTRVWESEGRPDSYYYGLVKIDCSGGCICGMGWVGWYKTAIGFDGTDRQHSSAGETHAHEVGHNHGLYHAPGCGATAINPSYPYVSNGKGYIGDDAHPNHGFDIKAQAIYPYHSYYDFMGYCSPEWVSDYTYMAILTYDQAHRDGQADVTPWERALLVSGSIDPTADRATLHPIYALDLPLRSPIPGDYSVELLDVGGRVIAAYPFEPVQADTDRLNGIPSRSQGFHLTLPYAEGISAIRIRHGADVIGQLKPGGRAPSVHAGTSAFDGDTSSLQANWSASDPDGDKVHYLVRTSTDGGATWQTVGVDLLTSSIALNPDDFGGQSVTVEVFASDGLHTESLRLGPFAVPEGNADEE